MAIPVDPRVGRHSKRPTGCSHQRCAARWGGSRVANCETGLALVRALCSPGISGCRRRLGPTPLSDFRWSAGPPGSRADRSLFVPDHGGAIHSRPWCTHELDAQTGARQHSAVCAGARPGCRQARAGELLSVGPFTLRSLDGWFPGGHGRRRVVVGGAFSRRVLLKLADSSGHQARPQQPPRDPSRATEFAYAPRRESGPEERPETFLSEGQFRRIIYLTTRARAGQQDPVFAIIARHGYREAQKWSSTVRTQLIVYQRVSTAEDGS